MKSTPKRKPKRPPKLKGFNIEAMRRAMEAGRKKHLGDITEMVPLSAAQGVLSFGSAP